MHARRFVRRTLVLLATACARSDDAPDTGATSATPDASGSAPAAPQPPTVGRDLRALGWIAGTWRGTGETQPPFYERYRLADDSTLVVESFADSTLTRVSETTRFQLRNGVLTSVPGASGEPAAGGPRWYASTLSGDSVRFEPLTGVRNSFVWRRGPMADHWVAALAWPAAGDRPARQVTYAMRRWR